MSRATTAKRKNPKAATTQMGGMRQIAAGEFKSKCLAIMDEVNQTGRPVLVTKRGQPSIKIFPARNSGKNPDSIFGRLKGIVEIVGDPDDLIQPVIPLEDWDMLK
ncbi:MAG TPA: type II toxin-antitoxin system prevent-host-death family antitoxin [Candidatus Angelobacter sp.]|nr:type II toxin-antitoxin system prevent-host-death family antitoxin [Candidatus Angelobacter sp.]